MPTSKEKLVLIHFHFSFTSQFDVRVFFYLQCRFTRFRKQLKFVNKVWFSQLSISLNFVFFQEILKKTNAKIQLYVYFDYSFSQCKKCFGRSFKIQQKFSRDNQGPGKKIQKSHFKPLNYSMKVKSNQYSFENLYLSKF